MNLAGSNAPALGKEGKAPPIERVRWKSIRNVWGEDSAIYLRDYHREEISGSNTVPNGKGKKGRKPQRPLSFLCECCVIKEEGAHAVHWEGGGGKKVTYLTATRCSARPSTIIVFLC